MLLDFYNKKSILFTKEIHAAVEIPTKSDIIFKHLDIRGKMFQITNIIRDLDLEKIMIFVKEIELETIRDNRVSKTQVERIIKMVNNAEHKRLTAPILTKYEYSDEEDEDLYVYVDDY